MRKLFVLIVALFILVPAANAAYIMPLGDSITRGYVEPLYGLLDAGGYDFDFVGSQINADLPEDPEYEGHPGWTADQIRDGVTGWLTDTPADIVLLHVGINDIYRGYSPAETAAEVGQIVDNIHAFDPTIDIILAQIVDVVPHDPDVSLFNAMLLGIDDVTIVDMEHALDYSTDMYNFAHPNAAGYAKMADVWYSAVTVFVPVPPSILLLLSGIIALTTIRRGSYRH